MRPRLLQRLATSTRFLAGRWNDPFLPEEVIFEVTTACNLRCPMCARTHLPKPRPVRFLAPEHFRTRLARIPDSAARIALAGLGEPLLHPDLPEIVAAITARRLRPVLYTNGQLLDRRNAARLIEAGLAAIIIPVDGAFPETYETHRAGGSFQRLLQGLDDLLGVKRSRRAPLFVELQMLRLKGTHRELSAWRARFSLPGIDALRYKPDHMSAHDPRADAARGLCPMPWRGPATVDIDGDVLPCCVQSPENVRLGNLDRTDMATIWNDDRTRQVRRDFLTLGRRLDSCAGCRIPLPPRLVSAAGNLLDPFLARRLLARVEPLFLNLPERGQE